MKYNWPTKKLGELLDYEQPGKYIVSSKNYSDDYKTPVLTAGKNFILGKTSEKDNIFPKDKLPVIIFDDFTTATQLVDFPFKVKSSAMKILHVKRDVADIKFMFYLMQTVKLDHVTHKRYWISEYSNIEISLPPLSEQTKIVAKIERAFAKIDEVARLRAKSDEDAAGLFRAALDEVFEGAKEKGWEEKEIKDICEHPQYGYTASAKSDDVGPKLLRITDIQNGSVDWNTVPYCLCENIDRYRLKDGDIVFARTGATVGKSYLVNNPPKKAIYASYLIRLRVKEHMSSSFLSYFFRSNQYWKQIIDGQVGMAQPNVNGSKLAKIKVPIPPLIEQKKIALELDALLEKVQKLQKLQEEVGKDLKELKKAVLREVFEGK